MQLVIGISFLIEIIPPLSNGYRFLIQVAYRQLQQPSIYNNKNARLRLRIELNMETERAVLNLAICLPLKCNL